MKNEKVQEMVRVIEALLKEANVRSTSNMYINLAIGEDNETIKVGYDSLYQSVIVSMVGFGDFVSPEIRKMMFAKIKAYESENEELTALRRQKDELERKIAELERM